MPAKEHDRLLALLMFGVENMLKFWLVLMAAQVSYVELIFSVSLAKDLLWIFLDTASA